MLMRTSCIGRHATYANRYVCRYERDALTESALELLNLHFNSLSRPRVRALKACQCIWLGWVWLSWVWSQSAWGPGVRVRAVIS